MKLPKQSANVNRKFLEVRFPAVASPTERRGVKPSSFGGGGGNPPPPPPPPFCTADCQVCYDRGQYCNLSIGCPTYLAPYQCSGVNVGGGTHTQVVHF